MKYSLLPLIGFISLWVSYRLLPFQIADGLATIFMFVLFFYIFFLLPFHAKQVIGFDHIKDLAIIEDGMMGIQSRKDGA
ncbi:MAG: hypothetical protein IH840_15805 [Candidatus Heimdallarchaeota archaeon]|nr:hypothetical protein [Candidatus Heimdallarchaeota archaeon]